MSWLAMLTMTVAVVAALECVAGRLAAMHWSEHRPAYLLGYLLAAGVCILAASLIWQQAEVQWLDVAAWGIASHLALTWEDWRHGPPSRALRDTMAFAGRAMPSRIDGGDRQG